MLIHNNHDEMNIVLYFREVISVHWTYYARRRYLALNMRQAIAWTKEDHV